MGNALEAAKFSVEKGNTGVGTKKTLLEGIDKAQLGVKTWKENIDTERLKLKTDTAAKYREAEMDTMKNLPSDKTSRDLALNALSEYKDRLYGNMGLVQSGLISADDNLIFQENGKQSFNILAQQINDYSKQKEQAIKEATGYYELKEDGSKKLGDDGLPIYVEPTAGGVQAALQDFHDRMGNHDFTQIGFGENGMGRVTFLKTKIDKTTNTRVLDLDSDGKPQTYGGLKEMSVLAFDQGKNQKSARFNLDKEVKGLVSGGLGGNYQELKRKGNMSGVIVDDQKNNPQFFQMLETAVDTAVITTDRIASVLSDNGLESERSQVINDIQAKELEAAGIDLDEKISYSYLDMKTGKMTTGLKNKYIKMKMASNNTMVPVTTPEDIQAARNVARTTIFGALDRKYIDKGVRDNQFAPTQPSAASIKAGEDKKKNQDYAKIIDNAVTGDQTALKSIATQSKLVKDFDLRMNDKKQLVLNFIDLNNRQLADIVFTGSNASEVGQQIAAQTGLTEDAAQKYLQYTRFQGDKADTKASGKEGKFQSVKEGRPYNGLNSVILSYDNNDNPVTGGTLMADAGNNGAKISKALNLIAVNAVTQFGLPENFVTVDVEKGYVPGDNDEIIFRDSNGNKLKSFEEDDTNNLKSKKWLDDYIKGAIKDAKAKKAKEAGEKAGELD